MKTPERPGLGRRTAGALSIATLAATVGACSAGSTTTFAERQTVVRAHGSRFEHGGKIDEVVGAGGSIDGGFAAGPLTAGMPKSCGETTAANPRIVAKDLRVPIDQVSCAGATAEDVLGESGSRRQPAQLRLAKHAMRDALVILDIGGNDTGWIGYQTVCVNEGCDAASTGGFSHGSLRRLEHGVEAIADTAYRDGAKEVLVDGYFSPGNLSCLYADDMTRYRVTPHDYAQLDHRLGQLNGALRTAAEDSGATFVSDAVAFTGHGVCATGAAPWIGGFDRLNDAAAWHPNRDGQAELAALNLQAAQS